jgi:hypothetical protein
MLDENGKRDFSSEVPGTRLCGDITYLNTGEGWLYLATVIDLCTGMVIDWNMAATAAACSAPGPHRSGLSPGPPHPAGKPASRHPAKHDHSNVPGFRA